jgi:hypothetical protein
MRQVAWQRFHLGKMKDGAGYHGQRRLVMKMDIEVIEDPKSLAVKISSIPRGVVQGYSTNLNELNLARAW